MCSNIIRPTEGQPTFFLNLIQKIKLCPGTFVYAWSRLDEPDEELV